MADDAARSRTAKDPDPAVSCSQARLQILNRLLKNNKDGVLGVGIHRSQDFRQRHAVDKIQVFRYTKDTKCSRLKRSEREFYEENGYILIRNLVPRDLLQRLQQRFQDVFEGRANLPGTTVLTESLDEGGGPTRCLEHFFDDAILMEYCKDTQLLDYVESFCGSNIVALKAKMVNKSPDLYDGPASIALGQEIANLPFRPYDQMVCTWTAIESVNREQGCIAVLPGTHRGPLLSRNESMAHTWQGEQNMVHLEMDAGDTLLYHPLLVSGEGPNRSHKPRKSISCHYAASECEYIGNCPDETIRNHGGLMNGFLDEQRNRNEVFWNFRGHLVRGKTIDS